MTKNTKFDLDLKYGQIREKRIESNQVHFRNDKYSIFKKFVEGKKFKNMDFFGK